MTSSIVADAGEPSAAPVIVPSKGRRRMIRSIERYNGRLSRMEFALETRRRLTQFIVQETDGADCLQLQDGHTWEQRVRACKERYLEQKRSGSSEKRVVLVVQRLDLLTLALCQDLDLPLYLGGKQGPVEDSGAEDDCVWMYNWSNDGSYCGNVLCGQELDADAQSVACGACQQVFYCSRPACVHAGRQLHQPHCSGAPDRPSRSYFMQQFEFADTGDCLAQSAGALDDWGEFGVLFDWDGGE